MARPPVGPVAATNVYDAPEAFTTAHCPPQIEPDGFGAYVLPEPAQAPDGSRAACDCLSQRQGNGCEAVDGGKLGDYLGELLENALHDSGHELSCEGTREVRTLHNAAGTPPPSLICAGGCRT